MSLYMGQSLAVGYPLKAGNHICLVSKDLVLVEGDSLHGQLWVTGAQCPELVVLPYMPWLVKVVWAWHQQHLLEMDSMK